MRILLAAVGVFVLGVGLGVPHAWQAAHAQTYPIRSSVVRIAADASPALTAVATQWAAYTQTSVGNNAMNLEQSTATSFAFTRSVNGMRRLGYEFAIVPYPQVLAYTLGLDPKAVAVSDSNAPPSVVETTFDWRTIDIIGAIAFDAAVLLGASSPRLSAQQLLTTMQQATNPLPVMGPAGLVAYLDWMQQLQQRLMLPLVIKQSATLPDAVTELNAKRAVAVWWLGSEVIDRAAGAPQNMRMLALASTVAHPQAPYTPNLASVGVPLVLGQSYVLVAPAGTTAGALAFWRRHLRNALRSDAFRVDLYQHGLFPPQSNSAGSQAILAQTDDVLTRLTKAQKAAPN